MSISLILIVIALLLIAAVTLAAHLDASRPRFGAGQIAAATRLGEPGVS